MSDEYGFSFNASSLIDSTASYIQAYLNYQAQKEALDWDKEKYYSTLEYNKPLNQMIRLSEAGVNPHFAYAKGTINNVASPAPHLQAPQIDIPNIGDRLEQLINLKRAEADINNVKAQNANIQKQNDKLDAETRKAKADARIAEHDAGVIEKSPTSSRANETQSLAQILGPYLGLVQKGYTSLFDFDKYGLPIYFNPVEKRKDGDYIRTSRLNNGEVIHYSRTGVRNQSGWR